MMVAFGVGLQVAAVFTALVCTAFLVGPYIVYPLRSRLCSHRGDGVWLLRSRYEAMLGAIDAQRVENAELQEDIRRRLMERIEPVIGASTPDEDRQTADRLDEWLRNRGVK